MTSDHKEPAAVKNREGDFIMNHRTTLLMALLVLGPLAGCTPGDPLNRGGSLSGKVTIDGEPVTAGNLLLISEDGNWTGTAPLRGDGTYTVKEPPLGNVKVAVQTELYRDRRVPTQYPSAKGKDKLPGSGGMSLPDPSVRGLVYKEIPEKYEKPETSGLTCVVQRGHQQHDFPLTAK
jgi:hypothetical protein